MATVKEITADIKQTFGSNAVSKTQMRTYLGIRTKEKFNALFDGVDFIDTGKAKLILVMDAAKRVYELQQRGSHI